MLLDQGQHLLPNPILGQARTIGNVVRRAKQFRSSTCKILAIPFDQLRMCVFTVMQPLETQRSVENSLDTSVG